MEWFWIWWGMAGILSIIELLTVGFLALIFALASFLVGLLVFIVPSLTISTQMMIFTVMLCPSLYLWWRMGKHWRHQHQEANVLNHRGQHYVGRCFLLKEDLKHHEGRIQIADTFWKIKSELSFIPAGTEIEIQKAVDGILWVLPVID